DESVDLCYLDPPFNSNRVYNVLFQTKTGDDAGAQIQAFDDTWTWSQTTEKEYRDLIGGGAPANVIDALEAMRRLLGDNDLLAYLVMMSSRLVELHRVLKPTGSLFLHCDPTASHYLKILLDAIFGPGRFRNEIVWCYTGPGSPGQRQFSRKHDIIFWYAKGDSWTFNGDAVRLPHDEKTQQNYKPGLQGSGFVGADHVIHEKGKIPEDYWQIAIAPRGKEYLGYPTQKPIKLLERIVLAASNPGEVVLDPFCGCGTALDAAQKLGRSWIGIDITFIAIDLIEHRLEGAYGSDIKNTYQVHGIPRDLEGAARLFEESHFEFERWAVSLVDGTPKDKPGGDKGIDGVVRFLTGATE
ncbi:MAG: site-specific DNA-methyltransferase, partial [Candidatus Melainabacteria bacterium HGW-Melainabacteria-1]